MSLIRRTAVVALTAILLSSCAYIEQRLGDVDRTVPDGGQNAFGPKHIPILNPGGTLYRSDQTLKEMTKVAENPYMTQDANGVAYSYGNRTPYQNQGTVPTDVIPYQPIPVAPQVTQPAKISSFTPKQQTYAVKPLAPGAYPALSATPPNPVRPTVAAIRQNVKQLESERELADAARREITNNSEVVSMQKDAAQISGTTPAPAPLHTSSVAAPAPAWKALDTASVVKPAPVVSAKKTVASMKPLEPIHLVPLPQVLGEESSAATKTSKKTQDGYDVSSDDSINLQPPAEMASPDNTHYLAENRYTARRARATQ